VNATSPETYYSGAGDGYVSYGGAESGSWDTTHNAATGTATDYTSTTAIVRCVSTLIEVDYAISIFRDFIPFDTSALPDGATITAAYFAVYVTAKTDTDNDGYDYLNVVQTSQTSSSSLVVADYDNCGATHSPTVGATAIDITGISTSAWTNFTLSSTGIGWISLTGITYIFLLR